MAQLRCDHEKCAALNTEILVAVPETAQAFREYWKSAAESLIGLSKPPTRGGKNLCVLS
jgi:hypothetical protein